MAKEDSPFLSARRALILDHPFFGSLIMHLKAQEDAKAEKGIWVDGHSVGFNPESLAAMDLTEGAGLLAKGVMQCALGHHVRRGRKDAKLWNEASALVTVPEIIDSGLLLPGIRANTVDRTYQGQSVEAVYRILEQEQQEQEQEQQQDGDKGNEGGQGNGGQQPQQGQGNGEGEGEEQPQTGEVRDLPGDGAAQASPAEKAKDEDEWKIAMQQALQNAKSRGTLPGNLEALIAKELEPKVSWKNELRRFMQSLSRDDLSWGTPNRRFISQGVYLPAVHSERMGTMVVVNDTSGSTFSAQGAFLGEMKAIIEEVNPQRIIYVQQDTRIAKLEELEPGDDLNPAVHGMGGTDFRPVFEQLETEGIVPACMVFLTDLDGPFPAEEPPYPVLWAVTGNTRSVPFGDVVPIDLTQE